MIDDPFDDFKHEVQGMNLFGYRVFWPEGFMKGAGDPCKWCPFILCGSRSRWKKS